MRIANLFFILSMAIYFTLSNYTSFIWSEYYYTNVFGYIILVIEARKSSNINRLFAKRIAISMWMIYLLKSIFVGYLFVEWIRFSYGIILYIILIIYYLKTRYEN